MQPDTVMTPAIAALQASLTERTPGLVDSAVKRVIAERVPQLVATRLKSYMERASQAAVATAVSERGPEIGARILEAVRQEISARTSAI